MIRENGIVERPSKKILALYCCSAILIYAMAAWNSTGYFHADEHFQILEFANYKEGAIPASALAWEFGSQIRPGLQVAIASLFINLLGSFGITDPFLIATILRSLAGTLSLLALWSIYRSNGHLLRTKASHHFYLASALLLWFLPFIGVRFSSETFSGSIFFIAVALMTGRSDRSRFQWMPIGSLLGLSFMLRYQAGILIAGLLLCWIWKDRAWQNIRFYLVLAGIAIGIFIGMLADRWLYDEWTFNAWEYARINILEGKASEFGTRPWHYYFGKVIEAAILPIGMLVFGAIIAFWRRQWDHAFTWASMLFVLVHILIAHKELRFLFPLVFMVPLAIAHLVQMDRFRWLRSPIVIAILLLIDLPLLLYNITRPATDHVEALRIAYGLSEHSPVVLFHSGEDPLDPWGLKHSFYWREGRAEIVRVVSAADLPLDPTKLAIYYTSELSLQDRSPITGLDLITIHRTYPVWITEHFNLNNWVERTRMRAIYRIERTDRPLPPVLQ